MPKEQNDKNSVINKLVNQAKEGSRDAAEELISRFKPLIISTIKRHHTGPGWEDMLQSASLSILEGIKAYDAQKGIPFPAYIKTKLNFDIYNLCRKNRNILSYQLTIVDEQDPLNWLEDETIDIQQHILRKEQITSLHSALAELQPKQREVIVMHFFNNITLKEIAKEMNISYKTAQRYKARGMKRLAELLGR
jgi:RNA polymerase sigma factor (sigma-70 family)